MGITQFSPEVLLRRAEDAERKVAEASTDLDRYKKALEQIARERVRLNTLAAKLSRIATEALEER